MRFTVTSDVRAGGVRFYRGPGNVGPHEGRLWSGDGELLGSASFASGGAIGWVSARFGTDIALSAGQTYVVSYFAPQGRYSADEGFFEQPFSAGAVMAEGSVYRYGSGGVFPTETYRASNYYVDLIYKP